VFVCEDSADPSSKDYAVSLDYVAGAKVFIPLGHRVKLIGAVARVAAAVRRQECGTLRAKKQKKQKRWNDGSTAPRVVKEISESHG